MENAVCNILAAIGENPDRTGLLLTPGRVARMYREIFCGIDKDPKDEITITYREDHDEIILVRDISFYSMCEHHLIPFFGKAHVAYLPKDGLITGLSKLVRVVEVASKRPQLQERMTTQIARAIIEKLDPLGVAVILEAEHLCMSMRGIKKAGSKTITSVLKGVFQTNQASRAEVLSLIMGNK
ncbi:MAG: GTP cyclohydrolase I FolE [Candidatus Melainabacteria bacterium RIFCSPLOWO2_02_FULL_35_15]|nr:MAG: GTP cyclohydrolase I FolE [Candidatus Melainabacteria bacterium RIFCSPLOWO2_12_FULL_35_11]OGI14085.1 MAG: GTP cyclohydrolase I FolE [Candidatus Melainabacteria bacterium RIFCSPLOWO2_02_FULL_35_15]